MSETKTSCRIALQILFHDLCTHRPSQAFRRHHQRRARRSHAYITIDSRTPPSSSKDRQDWPVNQVEGVPIPNEGVKDVGHLDVPVVDGCVNAVRWSRGLSRVSTSYNATFVAGGQFAHNEPILERKADIPRTASRRLSVTCTSPALLDASSNAVSSRELQNQHLKLAIWCRRHDVVIAYDVRPHNRSLSWPSFIDLSSH
ncbi:hypothetical protein M422DRAFT_239318 [Sphaerobolus stellatus SS14]|nr:hypothetical protein M422DRAFT_239318 [Sphaerobolus stellatus SS14]